MESSPAAFSSSHSTCFFTSQLPLFVICYYCIYLRLYWTSNPGLCTCLAPAFYFTLLCHPPLLNYFLKLYCILICVCVFEDNLWKSVLSFYHVGPGNRTQVIRFRGRLAEPSSHIFEFYFFLFSFYSLVLFLLLVPFFPFVKFNLSFYVLTFWLLKPRFTNKH